MDSGGDVMRDSRIYMMASVAAAAALALAGCAESSEPGQLVSSAEESTPHDGTTTDTSATGELFGLNPVGIGEKVDAPSGSYMQSTEPGPVPALPDELLGTRAQASGSFAYTIDEVQEANRALTDWVAEQVTDSALLVPTQANCDAWVSQWGTVVDPPQDNGDDGACGQYVGGDTPMLLTLPEFTQFADPSGLRVRSRTITPTMADEVALVDASKPHQLAFQYSVAVVYDTLWDENRPYPTLWAGSVYIQAVPDAASPIGFHITDAGWTHQVAGLVSAEIAPGLLPAVVPGPVVMAADGSSYATAAPAEAAYDSSVPSDLIEDSVTDYGFTADDAESANAFALEYVTTQVVDSTLLEIADDPAACNDWLDGQETLFSPHARDSLSGDGCVSLIRDFVWTGLSDVVHDGNPRLSSLGVSIAGIEAFDEGDRPMLRVGYTVGATIRKSASYAMSQAATEFQPTDDPSIAYKGSRVELILVKDGGGSGWLISNMAIR